MRSNNFILIIGILFILITDTLLYIQIRKFLHRKRDRIFYGLHTLFFISGLVVYNLSVPRLKGPESYYWIGLAIGILFLFYIPKIIFILLNACAILTGIFSKKIKKIVCYTAITLSLSFFLLILYSITFGRYNFKITSQEICYSDLPSSFDKLKIVQLSDLHLGSLPQHYPGIKKLVREVNDLHPDLILFTGDMVNNFASEMEPWIDELNHLKAKYGKFAVTGNHDYGHYTHWSRPEDEAQNMKDFYQNMKTMGFTLLNNANYPIIINQDTVYIAGVENWGNPPFPRYGNLQQATDSIKNHFIILLSHDPSHWRAQVWEAAIPLTLSGHTHAMQMGIKIGSSEWSPSQYLYPEYDGLYKHNGQYLHVSRGQGYLGFPGRIGLRPEITQIILTNNCN